MSTKTIAMYMASTGSIVGGGAGIWWVTKSINDASLLDLQESLENMPEYSTLDKDKNFNTTTYKDKYGAEFAKYLVGINLSDSDKNKNDSWWEWSFGKYGLIKSAQGKFANITNAKEETNSLKSVCKDAYGQQVKKDDNSGKIKVSGTVESDEYLESDIWKFCSIIGVRPHTLYEYDQHNKIETYGSGNRGSVESDRQKFISIDSAKNSNFWSHQERHLKSGIAENVDKFFHSSKDKTIKDICRDAYKTSITPGDNDNTTNLSNEVEKYCKMANVTLTAAKSK